jgi:hypothetical protein
MPKERSVQDFIDQLKEIYAEQEELLNEFEDEFGGDFGDDEDEEE